MTPKERTIIILVVVALVFSFLSLAVSLSDGRLFNSSESDTQAENENLEGSVNLVVEGNSLPLENFEEGNE